MISTRNVNPHAQECLCGSKAQREARAMTHKHSWACGMTLVEVMVAMAIFVTSFLVLIDSQNMNVRNSANSRRMTQATLLAQEKMTEVVLKYTGKALSEITSKEEGKFEGQYGAYRWEITSRDFDYDLSFLADMLGAQKDKEEQKESQNPLMAYLPKISEFIKKSSKELTVSIYWKEGEKERHLSLTTHMFDFKTELPI